MLARIKAVIWLLALSPLGWLLWSTMRSQLGPDPGEAVVLFTGLWALRILLLTLLLRPLREITGKPQFVQVRRLVGLFAWFYATLHLLAALFYVIGWSWAELRGALIERTYITLGMAAWLSMLPLALTSTHWAQRKLGRRWRQLHRLIYPCALFAVFHFIWLIRADYLEPVSYLLLLLLLLGWRMRRVLGSGSSVLSDRSGRLMSELFGKESVRKKF